MSKAWKIAAGSLIDLSGARTYSEARKIMPAGIKRRATVARSSQKTARRFVTAR